MTVISSQSGVKQHIGTTNKDSLCKIHFPFYMSKMKASMSCHAAVVLLVILVCLETASSTSIAAQWAIAMGGRVEDSFRHRFSSSHSVGCTAAGGDGETGHRFCQATPTSDLCRGGATAAAIKTMTARQMEAFNLFSGGVAGTIASCITNPLEVIKTQLQSSNTASGNLAGGRGHPMTVAKRILEADGPAGFWRGLPPTLVGIIPSRSAYFYAYQRSKTALGPYLPEGSPLNAMISGLVAGITGNTLTNPIWMVRTRMQILADASAGQTAYRGYGDAIRSIWQKEGVGGFYKGISASYWGCLEGSAQFIIYEQLKRRLLLRHNRQRANLGLPETTDLPKATYFWSAAVAKMFASILTYPHEVARTRMREQARSGVFKYKGMWQSLGVIAREEGRQGLYSGMGIHLLKVVPNSALMFLTYEIVRSWLKEFTIVDEKGQPIQ